MDEQESPAEAAQEEAPPAVKEESVAPEPEAAPVEAKPEEEQPEPGAEEQEEEVDLLGEGAPQWLQEFDARDKPFKVSKEQMDSLPMEAKQLIHNLRKLALDRTRSAADQKRALDGRQSDLEERRAALNQDKAKLYEIFQNPELQKLLKPPTGNAPPAYTEEGQKWRAEKHVAETMSKIVGKMTDLSEEAHKEYKTQQQQRTINRRVDELKQFSQKHPDFQSYKAEIIEYRKSHPTVSSEDVFYMLKAKSGKLVNPAEEENPVETIRRARAEVRSRLSMTTSSDATFGTLSPPKGLSARQKAQWYQKNPEAGKLVMRRIRGN